MGVAKDVGLHSQRDMSAALRWCRSPALGLDIRNLEIAGNERQLSLV